MSLNLSDRRRLGAAFAFCSLAMGLLLANHPKASGRTLAAIIESEASHRLADGLVHGGFIVILTVLIVCFVFLARGLGSGRVAVVVGFVTACGGCVALMASMILDGFAVPAIAARFSGLSGAEALNAANSSLILCGTLIRILMPTGLLFHAAAMLGWSLAILRKSGWGRAAGVFGLVAGLSLAGSVAILLPILGEHVVLGGIVLLSLWYLVLAGLLYARNGWVPLPVPPVLE